MTSPGPLSAPLWFTFPSNLPYRDVHGGARLVVQPTGHRLLYGVHGHRVLTTDPDGHVLHECEWVRQPDGSHRLGRARLRLDWGQWVGLRPGGLTNRTVLDLSKRPGWQRLRADDLRAMAAQALRVPLDEVRFFYDDRDLHIDSHGRATIQHRKDAFYVLPDGTFEHAQFMACMGAMHWEAIDFLPVVELFQSLLPGTGSAAFELIRALYDDQNAQRPSPVPLRYRGIPTYPSEAAFRLFSGFFTPRAPGGEHPLSLFMDPSRSHLVTWLPVPDPPRRYVLSARAGCITIQGRTVQKITLEDDPAGLPFVNAKGSPVAPYGRSLSVDGRIIRVHDQDQVASLEAAEPWGSLAPVAPAPLPPGTPHWTDVFAGGLPAISPRDAFSAVLLYPEDDAEISEVATQAFVADHLQDQLAERQDLMALSRRATQVAIDGFDAALTALIDLDRRGRHTVRYARAAFAQRQAQHLWMQAARGRTWESFRKIQFIRAAPAAGESLTASGSREEQGADLLYHWMSFASHDDHASLRRAIDGVVRTIKTGGTGWLVGPSTLPGLCAAGGLTVAAADPVASLPSFRMHRSILPNARVRDGLMVVHVVRAA